MFGNCKSHFLILVRYLLKDHQKCYESLALIHEFSLSISEVVLFTLDQHILTFRIDISSLCPLFNNPYHFLKINCYIAVLALLLHALLKEHLLSNEVLILEEESIEVGVLLIPNLLDILADDFFDLFVIVLIATHHFLRHLISLELLQLDSK